jgi:hypothetical protein
MEWVEAKRLTCSEMSNLADADKPRRRSQRGVASKKAVTQLARLFVELQSLHNAGFNRGFNWAQHCFIERNEEEG